MDVVELHDCFSTNELITYEALVCLNTHTHRDTHSHKHTHTNTHTHTHTHTHIHTYTQGLCGEGEGGKMVDSGNNTYGGKYVVNPRFEDQLY